MKATREIDIADPGTEKVVARDRRQRDRVPSNRDGDRLRYASSPDRDINRRPTLTTEHVADAIGKPRRCVLAVYGDYMVTKAQTCTVCGRIGKGLENIGAAIAGSNLCSDSEVVAPLLGRQLRESFFVEVTRMRIQDSQHPLNSTLGERFVIELFNVARPDHIHGSLKITRNPSLCGSLESFYGPDSQCECSYQY